MITHKVKPETAKFYEESLARKTKIDKIPKLAVIDSMVIPLSDGYDAEISLVNGDNDSGPYLDVVLYDGGQEVQVLSPSFDKLIGTYSFYDSVEGRELKLLIEVE